VKLLELRLSQSFFEQSDLYHLSIFFQIGKPLPVLVFSSSTVEDLRQELLNKNSNIIFEDSVPDVKSSLKKISLFATKTVKMPVKKMISPFIHLKKKLLGSNSKSFETWLLEADRKSRQMSKEEYYKYWISPFNFDPKGNENVPVYPGAMEEIEQRQRIERERTEAYNSYEVSYGPAFIKDEKLLRILLNEELGIQTTDELLSFYDTLSQVKSMMEQNDNESDSVAEDGLSLNDHSSSSSGSSSTTTTTTNSSSESTTSSSNFTANTRNGRSTFGANSSHKTNLLDNDSSTSTQKRTVFTRKEAHQLFKTIYEKYKSMPPDSVPYEFLSQIDL
jgi:hypothetical protein